MLRKHTTEEKVDGTLVIEFIFPILIGILISYEDLKKGVIRNRYIALLLLYAILFQFYFGIEPAVFVNVFLSSFLVSILFWHLGMWPAGDAKLFLALSLLFPPILYKHSSVVMDYLVNSFVPIFFFIFVILLVRARADVIKKAFKYAFEPYKIILISVIFLGFAWLFTTFLSLFKLPSNFFVTIFAMFIAYEILRMFFTAKTEAFFVLCAIIRIIIDYRNIYTAAFLYRFAVSVFIFLVFRFFILHIAYHSYTKSVKINKLKEGMILAEGIVKRNKKIEKISFLQTSLIQTLQQRKERYIHSLGELTKEDIEKIKKLKKEKKIDFNEILVFQKQPFAIFLLLGYILTLLFHGSFVNWIKVIMR